MVALFVLMEFIVVVETVLEKTDMEFVPSPESYVTKEELLKHGLEPITLPAYPLGDAPIINVREFQCGKCSIVMSLIHEKDGNTFYSTLRWCSNCNVLCKVNFTVQRVVIK